MKQKQNIILWLYPTVSIYNLLHQSCMYFPLEYLTQLIENIS